MEGRVMFPASGGKTTMGTALAIAAMLDYSRHDTSTVIYRCPYNEAQKEASFELLDPYKGLPEWEKRRRQSADAKAALLRNMKGKR